MDQVSTFFGLAHLIFSGTEQLSLTLQGKDTIQEGSVVAELATQYLPRLRSDASFDQFYTKVVEQRPHFTPCVA